MTTLWIAASQWLAAFFVAGVVVYRTRQPAKKAESPALPVGHPLARAKRLGAPPTTHTHRIAAFTLSGEPLPDFYLGDDDREVNRKWKALKQRSNPGHFELWHAKHGWRDSITRHTPNAQ